MIDSGFAFSRSSSRVTRYASGVSARFAAALDAGLRVVGLHDGLHVDDVALGDDVGRRGSLLVHDVEVVELGLELGQQRHVGRADDVRLRRELRQRVEDRVHRAHAHVADEQVRQPVERAELGADRVQVGQDLRRMLAPAVAAVDHRDGRPLGRLGGRALLEVPHRDDVGVELEHVDRVLHRLLVEVAGPRHLRVGEPEHVAAEPVHRGLGRHPRARARLVEGRQQRLVGEQVDVAPLASRSARARRTPRRRARTRFSQSP